MNCSVFVFFFSTIHYLKTHYVVRSPRVGWCNTEHEHGTSSLPWGDFVVSLQALERVHLLLSHKSVLRILSISPIKNLSEHRLRHAALYLIGEWCFPWFSRHAVLYALHPKELQEHIFEVSVTFSQSCGVTCL